VAKQLANLPSSTFFQGILERFWMQPYQLVCVVLGAGLDSSLGLLSTVLPLQHRNHLAVVVLPLSTLGLVASQVVATWHRADSSNNTIVNDMARQMLEHLPHAAVVLSTGDLNYYPLLYRQACLVSNLTPSLPPSLPSSFPKPGLLFPVHSVTWSISI